MNLKHFHKQKRKFKWQEYDAGFYTSHSTGLLLGNLVDGLPGARHSEAVAGLP